MKIVLFSDIHANLPALEAILEAVDKENADYLFCLGDLVNFAGWDNEVIDRIREKGIICLQGNHDVGIANGESEFDFSYNTEEERMFMLDSIVYVNKHLSDINRAFLKKIPYKLQLTFQVSSTCLRIVLVHFCEYLDRNYLETRQTDAVLLPILEKMDADILIMGHLHTSCHRVLPYRKNGYEYCRHLIQVGAVGKSTPDYSKANYCLLDIENTPEKSFSSPLIHVDFKYVSYDVQEVAKKIQSIGLSDAFDKYLV